MCSLGSHTCICGAEFKCTQSNRECPVTNGYDDYCYDCQQESDDFYDRELEEDNYRRYQDKWEFYEE